MNGKTAKILRKMSASIKSDAKILKRLWLELPRSERGEYRKRCISWLKSGKRYDNQS